LKVSRGDDMAEMAIRRASFWFSVGTPIWSTLMVSEKFSDTTLCLWLFEDLVQLKSENPKVTIVANSNFCQLCLTMMINVTLSVLDEKHLECYFVRARG